MPTDSFDNELSAMNESIAATEGMVRAFRRELEATSRSAVEARRDVGAFDRTISNGLRGAFDDIVFEGDRAADALTKVAQRLSAAVLDQALAPVEEAIGGAIGGVVSAAMGSPTAFAKGGVLDGGRVRAFAKGGVVSGPTTFPMAGGQTGLMGEAGPEAIMPLTRGPDGKLGVRAEGGGQPVNVVVNVQAQDAESFRRSRGQIASEINRAVRHGQRNM